jgi:hypothetical protein
MRDRKTLNISNLRIAIALTHPFNFVADMGYAKKDELLKNKSLSFGRVSQLNQYNEWKSLSWGDPKANGGRNRWSRLVARGVRSEKNGCI